MQLNQPIPPSYAGGDGQYDFILQGNQKPKKSLVPNPASPKKRALLVGVGAAILLVLGIILFAVLSSGSKAGTQTILGLAQTQTEIIRISNAGANQARDIPNQNYAATVSAALATSRQETTNYLASKKVKIKAKDLVAGQNPKTDAALKSAEQAGRYDEQLIATLESSLVAYRNQVSTEYKATSSKTEKKLLQTLYDQVVAIMKNQPAVTKS